MKYMNAYDIAYARQRFGRGTTPNRLALAIVVDQLKQWADGNSDGWAYWAAPVNAARKAIQCIESTTNAANDHQERVDISDAAMKTAVAPIKAFLTRHKHLLGEQDREMILRSVTAPTTPEGL